MSSNENDRNCSYANQAWNHPSSGKDDTLRAPNPATESRVLSLIKSNKNQIESQSQPKPDFSNPPPNQSSQPSGAQKSQEPLTLPQAPSVLSAEAQEFIPRSKPPSVYRPNAYDNSQFTADDSYSLSVSAAEFVPRGGEDYNYGNVYYSDNVPYNGYDADPNYLLPDFSGLNLQDPYNSSYDAQIESTGNPILDRFNYTLCVLNDHPGNMEEYLRPICEMIQQNQSSAEIVNDIVESLFEQSIQEANFRYTGARICQFLSSNLKSNPYFAGFHKIFFKRCQQDYKKCEELKNGSPQDQERLRGLAMFMAELFLNVEAETDGVPQRLKFLPKILIEFVQTLLLKPNDLDVKCACQLLKLSGGLIEDIVKHMPDECMKFEETITQLQSLQTAPDLSENAKFLISSVIKLKENDWNRSTSSPPKKSMFSFTSESNNFQAQEPVFYNRMGAPCSRTEAGLPEEESDDGAYVLNDEEEAAFLEWQAEQEALTGDPTSWSMNDTGYDSYQLEEGGDDGGMGDEVEAAYEEFLQEQTYIQGYQQAQSARIAPPPQPMMPPMQPPVHQMYNHPPPPMPQSQDYYGYQQGPPQPNMGVPGVPPSQMQQQPPQHPNQQQQQHHQGPYQNNDRYHYKR